MMMRSSLPTLLLTILTLSFLFFTISTNAHHACSDKFSKLAQQKNMSHCKKLRTLGAQFAWSYQNGTNDSTIVEIIFGAKLSTSQGWIAWGVNPGKMAQMIGTKAIVAIINKRSNPTLRVNTYNITVNTKFGCPFMPSDIGIVSHMSIKEEWPNVYTIYARLNLPNEKYNVARLNHVWQVGDAIENDHPLGHPTTLRNVDSTETIDLTSNTGHSTGQYRSYLRSVHGVLNIIGWGTLLPIGVIISRYFREFPFKRDPMWFNLHVGCQATGFFIGTAAWAIGLSLGHSSKYYTFHVHRTYGILIFTLSLVQMLAFRLQPAEKDDYRKYWNMYHHFLGYALLTLIVINIFKGISILEGGQAWKWGYIANVAFLGTIAIVLEICTWVLFFVLKSKRKDNKNQPDTVEPTNQKPEAISHDP